jgi:hypothetical protein
MEVRLDIGIARLCCTLLTGGRNAAVTVMRTRRRQTDFITEYN